jgi:DNA-directed RNA polymerase specialized sigma24 family protein
MAGSQAARNELCRLVLADLRRWLLRKLPWIGMDMADIAAVDVLMKYVTAPNSFDPRLGSLRGWLRACAWNRARDLLESERRRRARERLAGAPELPMTSRHWDPPDASETLWAARRRELLAALADERDRRFFETHLDRCSLEVQADALGVGDQPVLTQRRLINLMWKRLSTRLQRLVARRAATGQLSSKQ